MSAFEWPVRVYWEDTDAGGVVYYANYLRFLERCRTEWLRVRGIAQRELAASQGVQFMVLGLSIDYKAAARLDDALVVRGNDDVIHGPTALTALPDMLDERLAGNEMQRFPGEPGGSPAGGDGDKGA